MSRYLLDTHILSNVTQPAPSPALLEWMGAQADQDLFIATLTVAELRRGILERPRGKKREQLERGFAGKDGPQALFAGRILPFDEPAALAWAQLMAKGSTAGRPCSALDMMIAAIAEVNQCVVVTDNAGDFEGIRAINPLRSPK